MAYICQHGERRQAPVVYNITTVCMVLAFIIVDGSPWEILPPGIHQAALDKIEERFATNATCVEFLQLDRFTEGQKGIVSVFLPTDPLLQRKADS